MHRQREEHRMQNVLFALGAWLLLSVFGGIAFGRVVQLCARGADGYEEVGA
jgi:hypothetical protein